MTRVSPFIIEVACHEVGHAVCSIAIGGHIHRLTTISDGVYAGTCFHNVPTGAPEAVALVGGMVGQERYLAMSGQLSAARVFVGSSEDFKDLARELRDSKTATKEVIAAYKIATAFIQNYAAAFDDLAIELAVRRELYVGEVLEIVERSCPALLEQRDAVRKQLNVSREEILGMKLRSLAV